jgi:microsomal dipeptidase-like Zn-dependent dipeptidase
MNLSDMVKDFPATHFEYIENPGQWPNITRALVQRGYSDEEIKKIIGGNVLRLLEQTIG